MIDQKSNLFSSRKSKECWFGTMILFRSLMSNAQTLFTANTQMAVILNDLNAIIQLVFFQFRKAKLMDF